jgi:hypothetical protein
MKTEKSSRKEVFGFFPHLAAVKGSAPELRLKDLDAGHVIISRRPTVSPCHAWC